jgi:hypothetical protein
MNDQMNAPMSSMPSGNGPTPFYQVWINALTKPNEQTFVNMAASPDAKMTTAFLWVFIGSLVNSLLASLVQGTIMRQMMQQYGGSGQFNFGGGGIGSRLIGIVCGAPIAAVISVVVFAIVVGIVQFLAKSFGGKGTFDQLAYTFAAISTPFALISAVFTLLFVVPYIKYCFMLLSLLALLYVIVLQVMAVKAVNQFGWGQAAGSFFLPVIVLCCCLSVAAFGIGGLIARAINNGSFPQFRP